MWCRPNRRMASAEAKRRERTHTEEHACRIVIPSIRHIARSTLLWLVFFFIETGMVSVLSVQACAEDQNRQLIPPVSP